MSNTPPNAHELQEELATTRAEHDRMVQAFKNLRDELLEKANALYQEIPENDDGYSPGDSVVVAAMRINQVLEEHTQPPTSTGKNHHD